MYRKLTARFKLIISLVSTAIVTLFIVTGFQHQPSQTNQGEKQKNEPKNIIFVVGDGMGMPIINGYRTLKSEKKGAFTHTAWEQYLVGMQMTHPNDPRDNITDSSAAATAMATGTKTYNDAIAVDNQHHHLKSVVEDAKEKNMSVGFVVTSDLTDATPAAFGVHNVSRRNYNEIADQYFDEKVNGSHKIDILLGGGAKYFIRDDRNLAEEFQKDGYQLVTTKQQLLKSKNDNLLGLFHETEMDKAIDRDGQTPSLKDMTNAALKQLEKNENGFFMLLEGSNIDSAGHDNDVVGVMSEMEDFEKAVQAALDFAKKDQETLVIITADHSTGGFSYGSDGMTRETGYKWDPKPILAAKKTPGYMAEKMEEGREPEDVLNAYIDLKLTKDEIQQVKNAASEKDTSLISKQIQTIFDRRSFTGWTTKAHTGEDVPVYAYGPGKDKWSGLIDNTEHAQNIFEILEKKR
ncbi:alkaline phosphatase [Bacillus swezeyi]|uniref:Alkaline phosphatase n=1 Tax=Bacillus swezeyi TaxID=1925020 RepID=A0A5M8RLE6_9BACI|nr:alkaline phosphatase [Bacillus swezeyi]KAA6447684.1 alkaline phosphatase [Bacillus swezeyi]KAA6473940.1 alkaline phosphatase [Bacillus swezeyi]TYS34267.1 alkaline phosphatase [Bacillus swezeyi]